MTQVVQRAVPLQVPAKNNTIVLDPEIQGHKVSGWLKGVVMHLCLKCQSSGMNIRVVVPVGVA